jgi:ribosomal protein S12 methylthiotransferase accessory factor
MASGASIKITFPGGKRVNADMGNRVIETDQSVRAGGDGSAPEPFALFLASIGTCAGIYVLGFLQARGLPTEGVSLTEKLRFDEAGALAGVGLEITLPSAIPEKYHPAIVRAAESCAVKKAIQHPLAFDIQVAGAATTQSAMA